MSLGWTEIILIVVVALVVFGVGARKLPDIGRGLGEGIKNFRRALKGGEGKPEDKEDTR